MRGMVRVGCDIVHIPRFQRSVQLGGRAFLEQIFSPQELNSNPSVETLAGWFAAKEAVIKALGWKAGWWQRIEIRAEASGKPYLRIDTRDERIGSYDVSISHDGEYAMAVACFLYEDLGGTS